MIRRVPHYLSPGLPVGSEQEDVLRLTRLVTDLSRYARGETPSESELRSAPLIDQWRPVIDVTAIRFAGRISDHPLVFGPDGFTSRIYAIDPGGRWVRTYTRLWRTGAPVIDAPGT
jgi:hypothetical protein